MIEKLLEYYRTGSSVIKFIYINIIASLVFMVFNSLFPKINIYDYLLVSKLSIPYVWTFITHIFVTYDIISLLFGCLLLFFVERMFKTYFNERSFLVFFIFGCLVGSLVFYIISIFFHIGSLSGPLLGFYSILFSIIAYNPRMNISLFMIPINFPIYVLGIGIILIDVLIHINNPFRILTELSSAFFGYIYMKQFELGNDFLGKYMNKMMGIFQQKNKKTTKGNSNSYNPYNFSKFKSKEDKEIDKILDKISESGYDSLSKYEKEILFKKK